MTDAASLDSLYHPADERDLIRSELLDRQWGQVYDSSSSYQVNGYIQLNPSTQLTGKIVDWEAPGTGWYVPMRITYPNYPSGGAEPQTFLKPGTGSIGFIDHMEWSCGGVVYSEPSQVGHYMNGQRMSCERDIEWLQSEAPTIGFFLPDANTLTPSYPATVTPSSGTATTNAQAAPVTVSGATGGAQVSEAVSKCIRWFVNNSTWTPNTSGAPGNAYHDINLFVPPKYCSRFFDNLGTQQLMFDYIRFYVCLDAGHLSPIAINPTSLPNGYVITPSSNMPQITIQGQNQACLFRFEYVHPRAGQEKRISEVMRKARDYFWTQPSIGQTLNSTTTTQQVIPIVQNQPRVTSMTVNMMPQTLSVAVGGTTSLFQPTSLFGLYPHVQSNVYPLVVVNVMKNGSQYYDTALANVFNGRFLQDDLLLQLQDTAPYGKGTAYAGGLVNKSNFRDALHFIRLNLGRPGARQLNPDEKQGATYNLQYQVSNYSTLPGGVVGYQLLPIVEVERMMKIQDGAGIGGY